MSRIFPCILLFTVAFTGMVLSDSFINYPNDKYTLAVSKIVNAISNNTDFKHKAYERTAFLVDTFGPRLWGSETLELAIEHLKKDLIAEGFENVRLEEVPNVPKWVRGQESLTLYDPRPFPSNIPMVGLGKSVGGNVTAEIVMFKSFDEIDKNPELAKDKIVFFNAPWKGYGSSVGFRTRGPSIAAKYGAKACIIRSVASFSIENPHTGSVFYDSKFLKIPAAAVSLETADMFERMLNRKQKVVVNLYMEAHYEGKTKSNNVVAEYIGSEKPNEILLLGGHIDTWDVGPQTGANDDTAGFMVCLEAIRTLIKLGLRPKRTLRFIAWSGEEMGEETQGANVYAKTHSDELVDHVISFESDSGTRNIWGWGFSGNDKAFAIVSKINELFVSKALNTTSMNFNDGVMVDTSPLFAKGVPSMRNLVNETPDDNYYFTYHHSAGDTVNVLEPDAMDKNVAAIASMFYIIADLPYRLPRN